MGGLKAIVSRIHGSQNVSFLIEFLVCVHLKLSLVLQIARCFRETIGKYWYSVKSKTTIQICTFMNKKLTFLLVQNIFLPGILYI